MTGARWSSSVSVLPSPASSIHTLLFSNMNPSDKIILIQYEKQYVAISASLSVAANEWAFFSCVCGNYIVLADHQSLFFAWLSVGLFGFFVMNCWNNIADIFRLTCALNICFFHNGFFMKRLKVCFYEKHKRLI